MEESGDLHFLAAALSVTMSICRQKEVSLFECFGEHGPTLFHLSSPLESSSHTLIFSPPTTPSLTVSLLLPLTPQLIANVSADSVSLLLAEATMRLLDQKFVRSAAGAAEGAASGGEFGF